MKACSAGLKNEEYLGKLELIFSEYIGDKINRPAAGLSVEEIRSILSSKVKDSGLLQGAAKLFEDLHFFRYAPSAPGALSTAELAAAIKEMIIKLEKAGL
ncbi:MAG: hypothetical protein WCI43_03475 [Candidatus Firestonebacteria bacterium]